MALNCSHGSSFSVTQEKSSCPPIGSVLDGYLIKNCGCFGNSFSLCSVNGNLEGDPCLEMINSVIGDFDDPEEVVVDDDDDDVDLLPMDPFRMNMESTFTSFSDWIQDLEWGFQPEEGTFGVDETHEKIGDHLHFLGLSWGCNGTENLQPQRGSSAKGNVFNGYQNFDGMHESDGGVVTDGNAGMFLNVTHRDNGVSTSEVEESQNCTKIVCEDQGSVPHEALYFVLGYLGVRDLLSVEQVCRSLRGAVRGDLLLWRTVHIDQPLNERITDDTLVKLTSRAQGTLQCLILVNCIWITDSGLVCVVQSNPRLMKLVVPDCVKLTIEGILFSLRALKSSRTPGIKHLRIGGLGGGPVTDQQFEELKELLDASKYLQQRDQKPQFYRGGYSHIICEDGRAIDIEVCPRCQKLRPVYDCPAESCQQKHQADQLCRGCTLCIARCINCGRCIKDFVYEETFCYEFQCLNCGNPCLHSPEKLVENEATQCTIISQTTMYRFCLYG